MSDILNPFDYEDPVKSNKDESDVRNSFFYVQMIMYGRQLKKIEPDFPFSVKEILKALLGNARSLYFTEYYIKDIILHYRKSRLPFEQDIEKLNTNEFPLNKEIKRFFWNKAVNRFKNIDRYSCAQPPNHEKEKELQKLNVYFKLLKAHAYDYYPQLGELPARGLRELERTLYTLNYICVLDLQEARDRMLGLRTERICKIDNLNEQI